MASLISSSSLSNASGVSLWPAARGRNTFTRSKRTPRISARDGSLADASAHLPEDHIAYPFARAQALCGRGKLKLIHSRSVNLV